MATECIIKINRTSNGEKYIEEKVVIVDVGMKSTGKASFLSDEDVDLRRLLMLPLTKDLVYYPSLEEKAKCEVESYEIAEIYDNTSLWFTLSVKLVGETTPVMIHHKYFSEMQSPSFIQDMELQRRLMDNLSSDNVVGVR